MARMGPAPKIPAATSGGGTPTPREAGRRFVTVLFCDLVDSTMLSQRLDPEDLRDVYRGYQEVCANAVTQWGGYIAQYLGDGLLAYFGYPEAREDAPYRAVRAGLEIVRSMRALNERLAIPGVRLQVRVGIHTGLVVACDVRHGERVEWVVIGETPNIASRLQGLAAPDTVVVSRQTRRLIQGLFLFDDLGAFAIKGLNEPLAVSRVVRLSGVRSRFEVAAAAGLSALVGRARESAVLADRWEKARTGLEQVVLLRGEPGIGKSRLLHAFRERLADEPHGGAHSHGNDPFTIPNSLRDSLMARIDRLGPARQVAQLAAAIGREFSSALLAAVAGGDGAGVEQALSRLVEAEIVLPHGPAPRAGYVFKHALIRDAAYESLLKSARQEYHREIALALRDGRDGGREHPPEVLAHHFTRAGMLREAIDYWQRAGQRALDRSAHVEAEGHLLNALRVVETLGEGDERHTLELSTLIMLGRTLLTRGYGAPVVEEVYARARRLSERIGSGPQLFPILSGMLMFYCVRGRFAEARRVAGEMRQLAARAGDPLFLLAAGTALGLIAFHRGELAQALAHLQEAGGHATDTAGTAVALQANVDPHRALHEYLARTLLLLGHPDQAHQQLQRAGALAHEGSGVMSLAQGLMLNAQSHIWRRDLRTARQSAEALVAVATEQVLPFYRAQGTIALGFVRACDGERGALDDMRAGIQASLETGAEVGLPEYFAWFAEACGRLGRIDEGLEAVLQTAPIIERTGERTHLAELRRIHGELLAARGAPPHEVEAHLRSALAVAREQGARWWELRAAVSLARLLERHGRGPEAEALLTPLCAALTEGADTADVSAARTLLAELRG